MKVGKCAQNLLSDHSHQRFAHGSVQVQVGLEIAVTNIFHNDVEIVTLIVILDELDDVGMSQALHNSHLVVDLLVELPVLHEAAFFQLFSRKKLAFHLGGKLVHSRERSLANDAWCR
jgi:hypothetical protein